MFVRKGIPSEVPKRPRNGRAYLQAGKKKAEGTEGHAFTRAINRRAEGPTALPKAGAKPKAKRLNLLPLPLFSFAVFCPKIACSSPQTT
jgi:hypothetical protein